MHTGFYLELDQCRKKDPEADFDFLEEEYAGTSINALTFLHGYCNSFACELSKIYGYRIEEIRNYDNMLVHAYCIGNLNGKVAYIDIRGITTDAEEFFEEFPEVNTLNGRVEESQFENGWLSFNRYPNAASYLDHHSCLDPGSMLNLPDTARAFIAENAVFYDIVPFMSHSLSARIHSASSRTDKSSPIHTIKDLSHSR